MLRLILTATLISMAFLSMQTQVSGQGNLAKPKPTPQPTPAKPKTIVSGGVLNGKAISKPQPAYPAIARTAKPSGTVTVQVLINEDGRVVSAKAASGHRLLRKAAVDAAYKAKFSPTVISGELVKVAGMLTYDFVYKE